MERTTYRWGGKVPLSDQEREWRKFERKGRGSAPGLIEYDPWQEADAELLELLQERVERVRDSLSKG